MALNPAKLGRVVTFMKYFAGVVSLILLAKTLIWNKITLPASNLENFTELVENEPLKSIYKKIYQYSCFYPIYHYLMKRFQELTTKKLNNFIKILINIVFD